MKEMADYYAIFYPRYDKARFHKLADNLGLDKKRKINTFSKGMKRYTRFDFRCVCGNKISVL